MEPQPPHSPHKRARTGELDPAESPAARNEPMPAARAELYPPLDPSDMRGMLTRAGAMWTWMPADPRKFKPEEVRGHLMAQLEKHSLHQPRAVSARAQATAGARASHMMAPRPAYDHLKFFIDAQRFQTAVETSQFSDASIIAVPTVELAAILKKKGFAQVYVKNLTSDVQVRAEPDALLERDRPRTDGALDNGANVQGPRPPREVTLPQGKCPRWMVPKGKSAAEQLIYWFEECVYLTHPNLSVESFSPLRQWTAVRREAAGLKGTECTKFSTMCKTYVYIRTVLSQPPEEVYASYDSLRKAANQFMSRPKNSESLAGGRFSALPAEDYFTQAVKLHEERNT
mmetsp:Transcript_28322/g.68908  ORF Transcript_28322/g.68908 Transcript_28322/m.68908 type:complete len:343 (-) Transcript_28322:51-1079(-)